MTTKPTVSGRAGKRCRTCEGPLSRNDDGECAMCAVARIAGATGIDVGKRVSGRVTLGRARKGRSIPKRVHNRIPKHMKTLPMGTRVTVERDNGEQLVTKTRSGPWLCCGTWVVMVDGIAGGYALSRIKELK